MEKTYLSDAGPKVSPAIYGFYRWSEQDLSLKKMEGIVAECIAQVPVYSVPRRSFQTHS